ncbi:MAG TPA: acyl carrier protein, partial [Candidatus Didemnitutus sp.]|nr:acyl carrier protein [Candidatus Didemnitutus sp.]
LSEFLPGEDPSQLTDSTPLITAGILDSIATLKLVGFLESTFSISMAANETDAEHLDNLDLITKLVLSKK